MANRVHFVGIGGIGVSSLARYFLAQNWPVSGSDIQNSSIIQELHTEGVRTFTTHSKDNLSPDVSLIIHSQAILPQNPELIEARRLGIPTATYPEALGALTNQYKTIAIAGSHGKSTTTALVANMLIAGGLDPTVIVGTKLREFGNKNFRKGNGEYLVIEADEYREAFANYNPDILVITNVDREHLDYYLNFQNVQKAFINFTNNLKVGGTVIANSEDPGLNLIKAQLPKETIWFGLQSRPHIKLVANLENILNIHGRFNLSNALAAALAAQTLNIDDSIILKAAAGYRGAWRRMEYKGDLKVAGNKVKVFDDYAHHPTEIKATLGALREQFPKSQLICVFQPHQLHRLKVLFDDFKESFSKVDNLILLDAYQVKGRDEVNDVSHNIDSNKLAKAISKLKKRPDVVYLPNRNDLNGVLLNAIESSKNKSAVVVMMGAGDIVDMTPRLLEYRGTTKNFKRSLTPSKRK